MLITNAKIVTWDTQNQIIEEGAIYIDGGKIVEIGRSNDLSEKYLSSPKIDAHSQYVLPGNICAHTHFYGAFARGLYIPGSAPANFPEILNRLWWPLDRALSERDVYYSAMVSLIDAIKHGTTLLFDHHASPNFIRGSLSTIAQAVLDAGLRASLCYEVSDRNGFTGVEEGIRENVEFATWVSRNPQPTLAATFGLHASLTLSDKTLERCRQQAPESIGFHVHVAEHEVDELDCLEKYGVRVVERLKRFGMLGHKTIVVHAVHVDNNEIKLLADTQTWVTHQPRSNMNNAVGLPRVEEMLQAGIRVCLGNDGFSNAMWEEWKTAYLAHKLNQRDPRAMNGIKLIAMATQHNAALANAQFSGGPFGVIKPGAAADLIFVDYHPFTPVTVENLPWHILFGFHESMVTTTIVAGEVLMENRQLTHVDEEKITAEAMRLAPQVWNRYHQQF